MGFLLVAGGLFVVLFLIAFVTKRRLGVLAPALVVGALLSELWVGDLTPVVAQAGFIMSKPPLESVVAAALTLVPAGIILLSGPAYHGKTMRIISALLFALLANLLLLDIYNSAVIIEGGGKVVYDALVAWKVMAVSAIVLLAIFDVLGMKTSKPKPVEAKH